MGYKGKYSGQRLEELLDKVANNEITPDLSGYVTKDEVAAMGYATLESVNASLFEKVDKVIGKQLSTEDFTTALKEKLQGLANYNDSELKNAVDTLRRDLDALVSGNSTEAIETFNEIIAFLDGVKDTQNLSGIISSIEQQIAKNTSLANSKVDKVEGKQLSTEDFTTTLKNKLNSLSNYDDTAVNNAINGLQAQLNTLVRDNANTAIESFNEIIAFLEGIDDSQNLDNIIASIEQQIAALNKKIEDGGTMPDLSDYATKDEVGRKQDNLVSGKNIKTINGLNILGEGNIEIQGSGVSKNTAEINLTTPVFNAVLEGTKGNYIEFTFDTYNENGNTLGESITCTYTIIRASSRKTITERYRYNEKVKFNIDNYLKEGTNDITINIVGNISGVSTAVGLSYQVVNIILSDELDISTVYDLSQGAVTVEVPFTVTGYGTKIIEWYIDGVLLPFVKNEDEVVDMTASRFKYITLSNLQQGSHSLQFRAYTTINGEKFYTDTLYRDLLVHTGVDTNTLIGIATTIPSSKGVLAATEPVALFDVVQYIPYILRFATYSPTAIANTNVNITIDDAIKGVVLSNNGVENRFTFTESNAGSKNLSLSVADASYTLPVTVSPTTMNLKDITTGLVIDFNALGKSNNSKDRDTWTDGTYTGTLTGFNYNNTSGWVDGRLELNEGSSFALNLAPLSGSPVDTGRTIEIEWASKNVYDDDAIICDMRDSGGVGILITATKVSIKSINGVVIETEYKSNENVRIGFVINRASGVTEQKLSYIYANGVISRATSWGIGDDYTSSKEMVFTGSSGALVSLKSIKVYNTALTSDDMLNNYILYRDTVAEMIEVYDRNDIYEEGTSTFSPDKMMGRLPVMIVTGDIPTLENTSEKDTQIIVDIEYFNLQEPSKSFTMKNAAMRPQGTSSMGYPKKNFRIYTQKLDNTVVYDSNGQVIENKLYSFKEGAQPVNCWCLKADYAESSGTHNTGIARMWNDALFNAQIDGEYKLRTGAQKAALAANYPYDVRTTIDGFPILLFYRRTANDNLIFIGKYNFNNDKSTASVFGFKDIPGFDNSKMQCWEVLNNGNSLALFTTVDGFDNSWSEAFESRYPDTKTPNTDDLKAFCQWMANVSQSDFATEKWEHLNVYMMAAYWVYLMRHAGADQFVKNAMFTSEDGQKFYYILYDNDTINGLINTGDIAINPTDTRQTVDASGAYVFAGHDSRLWNMLEADSEFMEIVEKVDNALYSAGISYINAIKMFDEEQADKWVEKVYNQDAQYKYIGPYVEKGIDNLSMLQGKRDLHRRWWLSNRFAIYDAKYVSGAYKSSSVELKCINGTPAGQQFTIKAGYPLDYGYGINNVPRSKGVSLDIGQSHTFTTTEVVNLGDPIRIYGAPNIEEVDLSAMANRLAGVTITNVYTDALGTRLKKLILGGEGVNNIEVTEISGLKMAKLLTHLDVRGMRGIKSLDLASHPNFEELRAIGSEVASVSFTKGAPVNRLELPVAIKALTLEQLPYLTADNLVFENIVGIHTVNIKGCPNLTNSFVWVKNWYDSKASVDAKCTLVMDNVNWDGVNADDLLNIAKIGTLSLKGKVALTEITAEQITALTEAFGESAFNKDADFYIDAPAAIFMTGRTTIFEGESEQYNVVVFGGEVKRITWSIASGSNSYVSLSADGLLTTTEVGSNINLTIRATVLTDKGVQTIDTAVLVKKIEYPTSSNTYINGNGTLENEYETYTLSYPSSVNGQFSSVWSLDGLDGYAEIVSQDNQSCVIKKLQEAATSVVGTLTCEVSKASGTSLFSITKPVEIVNPNIAVAGYEICHIFYEKGLCANETFITKEEASSITSFEGITFSNATFTAFNGLKYFNIKSLPRECFNNCKNLESIELPPTLEQIGMQCFNNCKNLESIELPPTLEQIGLQCFNECRSLKSLELPSGIKRIDAFAFHYCFNLSNIKCLSTSAPTLGTTPFGNSTSSYVGRNTYKTGENILYVPVGAIGYDNGDWINVLCNPDACGFTISYTL